MGATTLDIELGGTRIKQGPQGPEEMDVLGIGLPGVDRLLTEGSFVTHVTRGNGLGFRDSKFINRSRCQQTH